VLNYLSTGTTLTLPSTITIIKNLAILAFIGLHSVAACVVLT
jgi:hypothetical protein